MMLWGLIITATASILPIKNKKYNFIVTILLMVILILLFAGNIVTPDQEAYYIDYNSPGGFYFESGYECLIKFFKLLGLSYIQFKLAISIFIAFVFYLRFKRFGVINSRIVLLLWLLTSFWYDAEQSRFLFASVVIIWATKYLNNFKLANFLKYCLCVVVAGLIHTLSFVYLILLCSYLKSNARNIFKYIGFGLVFLVLILGKNLSAIGEFLYSITHYERFLLWFNQTTRLGWVLPVALQIIVYLILKSGTQLLNKKNDIIDKKGILTRHYQFCCLSLKICNAMFLIMPLYCLTTEFVRLIRGLFILYFVAFIIILHYSKGRYKAMILIAVISFIIIFNFLYSNNIIFDDYFRPMITDNIFN